MPAPHPDSRDPDLTPRPKTLRRSGDARLALSRGLRIAAMPGMSLRLQRMLVQSQQRVDLLCGVAALDAPRLRVSVAGDDGGLPAFDMDEGYRLRIEPDGVRLDAGTAAGAAHGLRRLLQCIQRDRSGAFLPALTIDDAPRLPWRGLLIDIARHPMPLDVLLRTLDGMAVLGLNVLHLHLNDDQGFRIESSRCPALHQRSGLDGYLRIAEVERLVHDAADRGIRVVPELDVPGHAGAILWAHPELAAGEPPAALPRAFGPSRHALDPTLGDTWSLLDALVADLAELFPDDWLHLGGDEVHPEVYAFTDAGRRAWMGARGITEPAGVQAWFVGEMVTLLARHGRRAVGWDEVLHPDVPAALTVQCWRGAATLETALEAGHDALFSSGWYLDLMYPAGLHYAFDPAAGPAGLARAEARLLEEPSLAPVRDGIGALQHAAQAVQSRRADAPGRLIGGEACLWSELVTGDLLDTRLYGRLPAVAERLWSAHPDDEADHYRRLPGLLAHLEATTDCRPVTRPASLLLRMGVTVDELPHVLILLAALEPVRWYRRLLGPRLLGDRLGTDQDAGSGMGHAQQGRPYDADTQLLRPVDVLAPESLEVRRLAAQLDRWRAAQQAGAPFPTPTRTPARDRASERPASEALEAALRDRAHGWRALRPALSDLCRRDAGFAALWSHLEALQTAADCLERWLDLWREAGLTVRSKARLDAHADSGPEPGPVQPAPPEAAPSELAPPEPAVTELAERLRAAMAGLDPAAEVEPAALQALLESLESR